ncbi:DUF4345 domain-containing protein [Vibrio sp. SCSIO 43135]|uniref:DUF4345 domain-containing protein n=1 Tax=Vibrio sp. SCSIO 43135 TaxID=2819096 RepID=UPI0020763209|nr:DUF4345 domain-containing protein [Vibrio sp. SCSIO 43135]USD42800.1 DUF4345 domain-containing protein [Vibrio sp. SCSIO 43135]
MPKLLVYATALFFLVYGALFIVIPAEIAYLITDSSPEPTSATIDFRATYGGAQLAIGVILLWIVRQKNDLDLALVLVSFVLLLMALGRSIGIVVDGQANTLMYVYLVAEVVFGILALVLRKHIS